MKKIKNFLVSGCGCQKGNNKKSCLSRFPETEMRQYRLECFELEVMIEHENNNKLNDLIVAQLSALLIKKHNYMGPGSSYTDHMIAMVALNQCFSKCGPRPTGGPRNIFTGPRRLRSADHNWSAASVLLIYWSLGCLKNYMSVKQYGSSIYKLLHLSIFPIATKLNDAIL